jgi:cell division protein FtsW (lipid II flippase)
MKQLFITSILVLAFSYSNCQTPYYSQGNDQDVQEILTIRQAGYALTGLGASAIIYAAANTNTIKNPTPWYIGGAALMGGGICLIIFGKKDEEAKYWKGMQGYLDDKNFKSDILVLRMKFTITSELKNEQEKLNDCESQDLIQSNKQQ